MNITVLEILNDPRIVDNFMENVKRGTVLFPSFMKGGNRAIYAGAKPAWRNENDLHVF